jgi:hypothetical protein
MFYHKTNGIGVDKMAGCMVDCVVVSINASPCKDGKFQAKVAIAQKQKFYDRHMLKIGYDLNEAKQEFTKIIRKTIALNEWVPIGTKLKDVYLW